MADSNSIFVKEAGRYQAYSGSKLQIILPKAYQAALTSLTSSKGNAADAAEKTAVAKSQSVSIRSALGAIDRQRTAIREKAQQQVKAATPPEQSLIEDELDKQFTSESVSYQEYKGVIEKYSGSDEQIDGYSNIFFKDSQFKKYIIEKYGSIENYTIQKNLKLKSSVFNPLHDYVVDVTIITEENKFYKADHISVDEILLEALSGICTFYYTKVDNTSGKSTGTLDSDYIPDNQQENRSMMFSPLISRIRGPRVIIWDINKQRWNSFYMKNLIKFVRDETIDVE